MTLQRAQPNRCCTLPQVNEGQYTQGNRTRECGRTIRWTGIAVCNEISKSVVHLLSSNVQARSLFCYWETVHLLTSSKKSRSENAQQMTTQQRLDQLCRLFDIKLLKRPVPLKAGELAMLKSGHKLCYGRKTQRLTTGRRMPK